MSWRDQDQWRSSAPARRQPTGAGLQALQEERLSDLPLSARLNNASGLVDGLLSRESGDETEAPSTWGGLQRDGRELTVGTSFAHRRVTLILLSANVLSVFIFMAELDPSDAERDHLGGVFLVVVLITALSLVQSLGIRHGRQLLDQPMLAVVATRSKTRQCTPRVLTVACTSGRKRKWWMSTISFLPATVGCRRTRRLEQKRLRCSARASRSVLTREKSRWATLMARSKCT